MQYIFVDSITSDVLVQRYSSKSSHGEAEESSGWFQQRQLLTHSQCHLHAMAERAPLT